jgi:hypothetical protein
MATIARPAPSGAHHINPVLKAAAAAMLVLAVGFGLQALWSSIGPNSAATNSNSSNQSEVVAGTGGVQQSAALSAAELAWIAGGAVSAVPQMSVADEVAMLHEVLTARPIVLSVPHELALLNSAASEVNVVRQSFRVMPGTETGLTCMREYYSGVSRRLAGCDLR